MVHIKDENVQSPGDVIKYARQKSGLTMEELAALIQPAGVAVNEEMSETDLENVSGGGIIKWLYNKLVKKNTKDLEKLWKN